MRWISSLLLFAGCSLDAPPAPPDEHEMPEPSAPITQRTEAPPLAEGYLDRAGIAAEFTSIDGTRSTSGVFELEAPISRASVWFRSAAGASTPRIEVEPGWSNGQVGPWTPLTEAWSEGSQRIVAADLQTAATTLRFRIETADLASVESLWWSANVPLDPAIRGVDLPELEPPASSSSAPRDAWGAALARCGAIDATSDRVVLYRIPAPDANLDITAFLRAAQAFDQEGRRWCDLRASYLVSEQASWTGRGARRAAYAIDGDDAGRIAIAVLGCDAKASSTQAEPIAALLTELTERHGLSSADQLQVGLSPACPDDSDDAWLRAIVTDWLATDPFGVVVEPPTEGAITGRIWDASTGDASSGTGLSDAAVVCDCGRMAMTGATGSFSLSVPAGTHRVTVSKSGFVEATREVTVVEGSEQELSLGLEPEVGGVSVIDHSFLIRHFGGNDVDPMMFDETQDGFQAYLDAVGVTHFSASEYVVPNNMQVAADCGYTILLPPRSWWRKGAALGLFADVLRDLVNEPVILRNWWRPDCYNNGVGGAPGGDHPDADALDLDFQSARSRADAQRYLCETYWKQDIVPPEDIAPGSDLDPRLNMSIGLGEVTIHLGVLSSNGRRFWKYDSYQALADSGDCW